MKLKARQNWLLTLIALASFFTLPAKAQVNIGTEVAPKEFSILELNSSSRGLRMPQLTTTERDAISNTWKNSEPENLKGLWIYNTSIECLEFWAGENKGWISPCPGGSAEPCEFVINPISGYTPFSRRDELDCMKLTTQLSITIGADQNDYTYQWYHYTKGKIAGATTPTCTADTVGNYYCIVKPKCPGDRVASELFTVAQASIISVPTFMSYNLGADPTVNTPKDQMKYLAKQTDPLDATVYGGLFQWGRRTMKYAVNSRTTPYTPYRKRYTGDGVNNHSVQLVNPGATYDSTTGQILINPGIGNYYTEDCDTVHVRIIAAPPGDWRGSNTILNDLWGNGFFIDQSTGTSTGHNASFGAIGAWPNNDKRYQMSVKTINDPCPKGFRVPTQDEWERLSDYCDPSKPDDGVGRPGKDGFFEHTTGIYNTTRGLTWVAVRCSDQHCYASTNWTSNDPGGYAIYLTSTWSSAGASYKNGTGDLSDGGAPNPIIFLPANGIRRGDNGIVVSDGLMGKYWSSTDFGNSIYPKENMSYNLGFSNNSVMPNDRDWRVNGYGIRCVANGTAVEPCRYAEILEYIPESRTAVLSSSNPTVTLSIVVEDPGDYTFQWYNSTHAITGGNTQSVVVSIEDTYYCKVTPKNCSSLAIDSKKFTVTTSTLASGILYFDSSDGNRLRVGAAGDFPIADIAFTKFGGVVAFTHTGSDWNSSLIKFNPTSKTFNNGYTNSDIGIPRYNYETSPTDWPGITNVSSSTYHNGNNVKNNGKGDICKLVGLTAAQVKTMSESDITIYNSGYRLPTQAELVSNAGGNDFYNLAATAINWQGTTFLGTYYPPDVLNPASMFLPSVGGYNNNGNSQNYNGYGYYWTSTPYSSSEGYQMHFVTTFLYLNSHSTLNYGNAIRCIKNTP